MSVNVAARAACWIAAASVTLLLTLLIPAGFPLATAGAATTGHPAALILTGPAQTLAETVRLSPAAYIVDSQQVTLDGGYDVPLGEGWHDIDIKWTITSKLKCHDLGQDICAAGVLRYPNLACMLPGGQAQPMCGAPGWDQGVPQDDRVLGCPAHPNPPAHFTAAGQHVTICTSSLLGQTQTATALTYFMGYDNGYVPTKSQRLTATWEITDPWNPQTGRPVFHYHPTPCDPPASQWRGPVPPSCATARYSGPFRRVYSAPGHFGTAATLTLPSAPSDVAPTLPDLPQLTSQAGYAYLEAWAGYGPDAPVSELGLVYHQSGPYANSYSLYWSPPQQNPRPPVIIPAGEEVRLAMYAYPAGYAHNSQWPASDPGWPASTCQNHSACLIVRAVDIRNNRVIFQRAITAPGWHGDNMMFARVTSIAQTVTPPDMGNYFDDGAVFGPVQWSGAVLARLTPSDMKTPPPWASGSAQSWPDNPARVHVTGRNGPGGQAGERDTIDLEP